jgi:hypothetical protein
MDRSLARIGVSCSISPSSCLISAFRAPILLGSEIFISRASSNHIARRRQVVLERCYLPLQKQQCFQAGAVIESLALHLALADAAIAGHLVTAVCGGYRPRILRLRHDTGRPRQTNRFRLGRVRAW